MDVMLVAAKKDIVEDYVSLLHLTGLSPAILDVDAFALQNAFELCTGKRFGLLCHSSMWVPKELGINAIKDGISIFTRDSLWRISDQ